MPKNVAGVMTVILIIATAMVITVKNIYQVGPQCFFGTILVTFLEVQDNFNQTFLPPSINEIDERIQ